MKLDRYVNPKSSFLSIEKDFAIIVNKMLDNERLKKLLFYQSKDCLERPNLTEEETQSLIGNQIRIVPKLRIDSDVLTYIVISCDNYLPSGNPEYRDNELSFDVICHFDQWNLGDFKLRPYTIAGELDAMFNNQKLTGIGTLQFFGATQVILNEEFAGISLLYSAVHGNDDRIESE